jgi:hypothetical protein
MALVVQVKTVYMNHDLGLPVVLLEAEDGTRFEVTVHPNSYRHSNAWSFASRLLADVVEPPIKQVPLPLG